MEQAEKEPGNSEIEKNLNNEGKPRYNEKDIYLEPQVAGSVRLLRHGLLWEK